MGALCNEPERAHESVARSDTRYGVETLVAMQLREARAVAEHFAEQATLRDCIITVPPYFNQAERRALVAAADIADVNLLQVGGAGAIS